MLIERISQMIEIRDLQNKYSEAYGVLPYNVSSWLTSTAYSQTMLDSLKMPETKSIEYVYTYSMDKKILDGVKKKLAPNTDEKTAITFVDNGTQAIITLVNLIKWNNYKKICILNPAYFSIAQALQAFGIDYDMLNLERIDGRYVLPYQKLLETQYDVIWLTSPVFSTSVYYDQDTEKMLRKLMDMGTLIISDECFCVPGNELIRRIENQDHFIAIYSPHKSLCINTFKFAALIYPKRFDVSIEHWVDVLTGNLPASSLSAISHFLDENYDQCLDIYKQFTASARKEVRDILHLKKNIIYDDIVTGSLLTLYFKNLTYEQITSLSFLKNTIFRTGVAFYPSFLNGLDDTFGFSFRINLALCDEVFLEALNNLACYLSAA